jgi:DNA repair protein RadA/Sms
MYNCNECGYKSIKWLGKCPTCGTWESFIQENQQLDKKSIKVRRPPKLLKEVAKIDAKRISVGFSELDKILGGGVVEGSIILVGGPPGVGKSTLLLEVCSKLSDKGKTLYVSAEESPEQISLRTKRLVNSDCSKVYVTGDDTMESIFDYVQNDGFKFIVVDSIQVVSLSSCEGAKGSISQIRGCADYLTQIAKTLGVVVFVVGHVTKDGAIAGPKLLEHIVDCVLYFEGEMLSHYRILRSTKNRFGPTGDIAVFEMKSTGLEQVTEITEIFLPHREQALSGSSVVCTIEGLRPILIELQALASHSNFGVARRRSLGFDFNRFSLLIAIIEKRLRLILSGEDVFLNVAGGLKVNDPATDLGAIMSIISSFKEQEIPASTVFMGEVGLAGELRKVNNINLRLQEVERTNFKTCVIPEVNIKEVDKRFRIKIISFSSLEAVVKSFFS